MVKRLYKALFKVSNMVLEESSEVSHRIIMVLFMRIGVLHRIIWFKKSIYAIYIGLYGLVGEFRYFL